MRIGNRLQPPEPVVDAAGLWAGRLAARVPEAVFDAHAHLGPPEAVGPFSERRLKEPLCTFGGLEWEEYLALWEGLFPHRRLEGVLAFGFPMREVDIEAANAWIRRLMARESRVHGLLLAHPTDAAASEAEFRRARADGLRYSGVKPYFDLLGKSNYATRMEEFIPEGVLEFLDAEGLILMLHTSGEGMSEPENREYIRRLTERHRNVRVILAHMGRYLEASQFDAFADSRLMDRPNLYLEMSSATSEAVYRRVLGEESWRGRLLFGTDLPYGLITGVEAWSEQTGPTFITRESYPWSVEDLPPELAQQAGGLSYNTWHVIDAFERALEAVIEGDEQRDAIRRRVFRDNALELLNETS
jgi:predicted TIM-barrel fold metal-dependent hydrolase